MGWWQICTAAPLSEKELRTNTSRSSTYSEENCIVNCHLFERGVDTMLWLYLIYLFEYKGPKTT